MRNNRFETTDASTYQLLLDKAREMRKNPTEAESVLWTYLSDNKIGVHFRRQHPVYDYIPDFVSLKNKLIIEIDGGYHFEGEQPEKDAERTSYLHQAGFVVLRFTNDEVIGNIDDVLEEIADALEDAKRKAELRERAEEMRRQEQESKENKQDNDDQDGGGSSDPVTAAPVYTDIDDFLGVDGIEIDYSGYQICEQYPEQTESDDWQGVAKATAGCKFVVFKFDVSNDSDSPVYLDMASVDVHFAIDDLHRFTGQTDDALDIQFGFIVRIPENDDIETLRILRPVSKPVAENAVMGHHRIFHGGRRNR
jgi:very-short-patch-repair endonuclease